MKSVHILSLILLISSAPLCKAQSFYERDIQLMKAQVKECNARSKNYFYEALFFSHRLNSILHVGNSKKYLDPGSHSFSFSKDQRVRLDSFVANEYHSYNDSVKKVILYTFKRWCVDNRYFDPFFDTAQPDAIAIIYNTKRTAHLVKRFCKIPGSYWGSLSGYQDYEVSIGLSNMLEDMNEKQKAQLLHEFIETDKKLLKEGEY